MVNNFTEHHRVYRKINRKFLSLFSAKNRGICNKELPILLGSQCDFPTFLPSHSVYIIQSSWLNLQQAVAKSLVKANTLKIILINNGSAKTGISLLSNLLNSPEQKGYILKHISLRSMTSQEPQDHRKQFFSTAQMFVYLSIHQRR